VTALWPALVLILATPAAGWVLGLTVHWCLELRALTRQAPEEP
jgi:hypothetical protein